MLASPASSSGAKKGSLVLRLLAVLVALVLIDLMLTIYLFVFSDGPGKLGGGLSKGKTPTVSTVIEVHKQIKTDAFTPYVAVESSPAVMVKESRDIWLVLNLYLGRGKSKGNRLVCRPAITGWRNPMRYSGDR